MISFSNKKQKNHKFKQNMNNLLDWRCPENTVLQLIFLLPQVFSQYFSFHVIFCIPPTVWTHFSLCIYRLMSFDRISSRTRLMLTTLLEKSQSNQRYWSSSKQQQKFLNRIFWCMGATRIHMRHIQYTLLQQIVQ